MNDTRNRLAVIAIGGNSLIRAKDKQSVTDQYEAICRTVCHIADVVESGRQVCVTHGNGPQVGFILLRSELARRQAGLHPVPLVSCVADSQGAIGWQIQQALANELRARGLGGGSRGQVVSLVTQVVVDADDPGFGNPTKFVGEFYAESEVPALRAQNPQWVLKADANRGWRRVVPSPLPRRIVEIDAIRALLAAGFNLVAAGGGGIPVVADEAGGLRGVDAVIDKDLASSLLANRLGADTLVISTAVEKVCIDFGTPSQRELSRVTAAEMRAHLAAGQFPEGSMGPKVKAALDFLANGGERVIITTPENLKNAMADGGGTQVVN
ncbi:carbamate kinase [Desulfocurvus sp.]|jgi:carbamate kinase|uniref:carbamate kinase n=1 Tax=Desulfocurvus sp. TaxID=2871698 RepID=UPI0025C15589|nr:carbamate kinase [Desulfocurvus sp.]MCK9240054.1 carbamate kinase [Desulfocurvus sp.]